MRSKVAAALGTVNDARAFDALLSVLDDAKDDGQVRVAALQVLQDTRHPRALKRILAALKDENSQVREFAGFQLRQMTNPLLADDLLAALQDKYPYGGRTRLDLAQSLAATRHPHGLAYFKTVYRDLRQPGAIRAVALGALAGARDPAIPDFLIAVLKDPEELPAVREKAAVLQQDYRDPRAVEPLIAILNDPKDDERVRSQAALALGVIGDRRAIEPLKAAAKSKNLDVSSQAENALEMFRKADVSPKR